MRLLDRRDEREALDRVLEAARDGLSGVLAVWSDWADDVRGQEIDSGHFLVEEAPEPTFVSLRDFFVEGVSDAAQAPEITARR
jgi:hypothetical protein